MIDRSAILRRRPAWFAALAALAILVRMLVPVGFMPQVALGQVAIVACPGVVAAHGHAHETPGHDGFAKPCAFAAVSLAAAIVAVAVLLSLPLVRVVHAATDGASFSFAFTRRWRPPLRAPPAMFSIR